MSEIFVPGPALIARMRELKAQSIKLSEIAETLTAEGFAGPAGGAWTPSDAGRLSCLVAMLGTAKRPPALVERLAKPWFARRGGRRA